jgi:hypothetical protein
MIATIQPPFVAFTSDYIVTRTNNRIPKITLNYRPNGQRQLGRYRHSQNRSIKA